MTRRTGGLLGVLRTHHLEHEPQHLLILMLLAGVLSLGAAVGVAWVAGFGAVAHTLRHVNLFWFPFAMAGAVMAHIGYVFAYREVAEVDRGTRISALRAGAVVAAGFGMFFPRGGFAVDLEALEDLGVPRDEARIRVLGLGSLEYAVLAAGACACAAILLAWEYPAQRAVLLSWVIGVPVGTSLAMLAVAYRDAICRFRVLRFLRPPLEAISVVGKILAAPRRHGFAAFSGMALYWAGEVFVLWICLAAFTHHRPSVPAVVVGYATGYALTRRTLPLAGAGAVEALLPFALLWVGYPLAAAVLAVFAYRVFNLWLPIVPAAAAIFALRRNPAGGG
ncbi:MAG TPA: lysylphosphatidylglycerol synthase domain-containing protein [Gaiellaceae bacterium]|nr:lysylphosphatidylglycerol synthase domain-containing protein [Gaiellaceae bacterium]